MSIEQVSLYALWLAVLVNLGLTVRLLRWARLIGRSEPPVEQWAPELPVGTPAPTFRARLLDGGRVSERSWAGHHVAYVFLSPNCDSCRTTMPKVQAFVAAAAATGTRIVVVTDTGPKQTGRWLEEITDSGAEIVTPVVCAPGKESKFIQAYDGPGFFPYFVFVASDGTVIARGIVGRESWLALIERWSGRVTTPVTTVIPDGHPAMAGL